jgi:hypothetical protein
MHPEIFERSSVPQPHISVDNLFDGFRHSCWLYERIDGGTSKKQAPYSGFGAPINCLIARNALNKALSFEKDVPVLACSGVISTVHFSPVAPASDRPDVVRSFPFRLRLNFLAGLFLQLLALL